MKTLDLILLSIGMVCTLAACGVSQKKTAFSKPSQVVTFNESEVPYFQVTKKDGKVFTEIIGPAAASGKSQ